MASISKQSGGRKTIQFIARDGRRKSIRLGVMSVKDAAGIRQLVEALRASQESGQPMADKDARRVAELSDAMAKKLSNAGLIQAPASAQLGPFLDEYKAGRVDVKPRTLATYRAARANLVGFFGESKLLRDVTPGSADEFRLHLISEGLSAATVARRCGHAKQFFKVAVRKRLIERNPFDGLSSGSKGNASRQFFVTREMAWATLDACPDHELRTIFVLARFGALRTPSETLALRWCDIDWAGGRFLVRSCKTERHAGHESRWVPLFPELLPYLRESFEQAKPGDVYVIGHHWQAHPGGLPGRVDRIVKAAGLTPWEKTFQNCRSSRETELCEVFPEHVVTRWVGNSVPIARRHYLQVRPEDYAKAATVPTGALHFPVHQVATQSHTESQPAGGQSDESAFCGCVRLDETACDRSLVECIGKG